MPSRKKNKGRGRKARKKASGGAIDELIRDNRSLQQEECCQHGLASIEEGHPCHRFSEWFQAMFAFDEDGHLTMPVLQTLRVAHEQHPDALNDGRNRNLMRTYFLANGTGFIQDSDDNPFAMTWATGLAFAVMILEEFDPTKSAALGSIAPTSKKCMEARDVIEGCERSLIRFFKKRIPCSCLDGKYADVRMLPKTSICRHCSERKEKCTMMLCTGCETVQYCSQGCQAKDWPRHKDACSKRFE